MRSKLNQLLKCWPADTVTTQSWLTEQGISWQLTHAYRKSGWLERIAQGAYIRSGDKVGWKGMVYGLQHHVRLPIWPGGQTALAMHGYAHYLPMARETVWLFAAEGTRLPSWVRQYDWRVNLEFRKPQLFTTQDSIAGTFVHLDVAGGRLEGLSLTVSSLERASLELLYTVKDQSSFNFASETFQGLLNLRPTAMQAHLKSCRSVKVKRLALFLGKYFNHPWYSRLEKAQVQLGAGKRQIVKGGVYNPEFMITIPPEFSNGPE